MTRSDHLIGVLEGLLTTLKGVAHVDVVSSWFDEELMTTFGIESDASAIPDRIEFAEGTRGVGGMDVEAELEDALGWSQVADDD